MGPNFTNPVLTSEGLQVGGTFDTHGEVIDDVVIRFLLIPPGHDEAEVNPPVHTAVIENAALEPSPPSQTCRIQHGEFSVTVPNTYNLGVGAVVRAIGIAVAVKRADPRGTTQAPIQDPPAFETFTWCVTLVVM